MSKRLTVPKTYKLAIGGAFPRSESGRTYEVVSPKGAFLANAAKATTVLGERTTDIVRLISDTNALLAQLRLADTVA